MESMLTGYLNTYWDFDDITEMTCDNTSCSQAELIIRAYCLAEYLRIYQQAESDEGDMGFALYGLGRPTDNTYVKQAFMNSLTGLDSWVDHIVSIYRQFCESNVDLAQHFFWIQTRNYMELERFVAQEKFDGQAFLAAYHEKDALTKFIVFLREIAKKYISVNDVAAAMAEAEDELDNAWIECIDKILCGINLNADEISQ